MLWLPIFLPLNFTKELLENGHEIVIFQKFHCKIVPL